MTDPTPRVTIAQIQQATAEHFGLPREHIIGAHRFRKFVRPQQVAMYLARELTGKSLRCIGMCFHQDHKAVVRSHGLIEYLAKRDQTIAKAIDDITRQLTDDPRQINLPLVA